MAPSAPGPESNASAATAAAPRLRWALCVATLDRIDALERCVDHALRQTRMPSEIVIADAGSDHDRNRARIAAKVSRHPSVSLVHFRATVRSSASQRNEAARAATADVLFMIDDDSFMHADCAERIMAAYEADTRGLIAAISCADGPDIPGTAETRVPVKESGLARAARLVGAFTRSRFGRFVWREVFLMSTDRHFVRYEDPRPVIRPELVRELGIDGCVPVGLISGSHLTVRRDVVLREPFEDALLAYSPGEDLDASYRFTRHGAKACLTSALLCHHSAAAGRLKRRKVAELAMSNLAFFLRKRSTSLRRDIARYYVLSLRCLLAETLKDGLSRRWSFPEVRGSVAGIARSVRIFRADRESLDDWYRTLQLDILSPEPPATRR